MQKLCNTINPDLIYVCWDGEGGSKKRKLMNSNYKEGRNPLRLNRDVRNLTENEEIANRIWQQTRVAEYFNQMPVIQLLYPGIEADDLISYVVNHQHYKRWQKVIVSSDKDFIQLIDDNIKPIEFVHHDDRFRSRLCRSIQQSAALRRVQLVLPFQRGL
jgi:5'-3' exonuclease